MCRNCKEHKERSVNSVRVLFFLNDELFLSFGKQKQDLVELEFSDQKLCTSAGLCDFLLLVLIKCAYSVARLIFFVMPREAVMYCTRFMDNIRGWLGTTTDQKKKKKALG